MDKAYDHTSLEGTLYSLWEENGVFKAAATGTPYTILMPPPNANASLHAGHAMYTIDDVMIRWKRMQGYSAVWIPGTDHAGFETQFVYEKHLAKQGKSRLDFDRHTLYNNIYTFVTENSGLIFNQFRRLGFSADWSRSVFTLDPHVLSQVFSTFQKMESEGKVYRDEYMVNFCTYCGTSLAELEVDHEERIDTLYYIHYPLVEDPSRFITVATVRPETLFGDTAVAIHPEDSRMASFRGKKVRLPLTHREIPVIEDPMVDREFGTGAVKITPAHDPADFETGKRHALPSLSVIDLRGRMHMPADADLQELEGLKVKQARELTVAALVEKGYLDESRTNKNYLHSVTVCYKCKRDLEPTITPNWFIRVDELKKPVIAAVEQDKVKFYPKKFKKQMLDWLHIMHDWPISRQVVWGIRIPVWYEIDIHKKNVWVWWLKNGVMQQGSVQEFLASGTSISEIEAGLQRVYAHTGAGSPRYVVSQDKPQDGKMYLPETDTFDTWFSSGQWPLVALQGEDTKKRLPTDFIGTLSDILKFWISRMIMFSLYAENVIPYKDVYLWSMVADAKGVKMSKSKGNVVNPIELVDKYGADALRMTLLYGVAPGSKIPLAEEKVKGMRNFANKIWNMGRFIKMMCDEYNDEIPPYSPTAPLSSEDKEIISQLHEVIKKVTASMGKYRFSDAAEALYEFMWHTLADVYIEQVKSRKNDPLALSTVRHVYTTCITLLHPFMPFVTEAVWQKLSPSPSLLATASWPKP